MVVQLKGDLDFELTRFGLKAGDQIEGTLCPVSTVGAFHFNIYSGGMLQECVVWPKNYDIISEG